MRGGDPPAVGGVLPELGLQPGGFAVRRPRHDEHRVRCEHADLKLGDPPCGDGGPAGTEPGDRLVPDEQDAPVAAHRVGPRQEQLVEYVPVVGEQRGVVAPERVEHAVGQRAGAVHRHPVRGTPSAGTPCADVPFCVTMASLQSRGSRRA